MNRRAWMVAGLAAVCVICLFMIFRTLAGSPGAAGQDQENVANFAKSIDHTKSNTPSVPEEKLRLGVTGGKRPSAK